MIFDILNVDENVQSHAFIRKTFKANEICQIVGEEHSIAYQIHRPTKSLLTEMHEK
jgi:hypothetical protein